MDWALEFTGIVWMVSFYFLVAAFAKTVFQGLKHGVMNLSR